MDRFDGLIQLTGITGICEYNGQFLVVVEKMFGDGIKEGQKRLFDELADLPEFTVLVVWGSGNTVKSAQIRTKGNTSKVFDLDEEGYRKIVMKWRLETEKFK